MFKGKVLIAEDEPAILASLGQALSDAGFSVLEAEAADAALDLFKGNDVSLLLTDIAIPGPLDGVALAQLMRQQKPQLPVIFLSGHFSGLANADGVAPPSAFFVKPARMDEVVSGVRRLLGEANVAFGVGEPSG